MRRKISDMDGNGTGQRFDDVWPELARQLEGMLRSRGIDAPLRDDVVQDTALRLLQAWDDLDLTRPVDGLAVTIALNVMRDHFRRRCNQEVLGEIPERPSDFDVERAGMARSELHRVGRAMSQLSSDHRLVLLREISDRPNQDDRGPAAIKMLRMRARRRLRTILETASGFVVGFNAKLRRDLSSEPLSSLLAASLILATGPAAAVGAESGRVQTPRTITASKGGGQHHLGRPLRERIRSGPGAGAIVAAAHPPPVAGANDAASRGVRPLSIPFGDSEATVRVRVKVGDTTVEVGDSGGPAPVCLTGVPQAPPPMNCPASEGESP